MSCGIYKITNTINNKVYIGQSSNIEERWKKHKYANDNFAIHKAIRKYGVNKFVFSIIEECPKEELNDREIYWIDYYNSLEKGYNMIPGGSNGSGYAKGKIVCQYSLSGDFIAEYPSTHQADLVTGVGYSDICACCRSEKQYAGKFQWKYKDSNKQINPIDIKNTTIQRPINQYTKDGQFIIQYKTLAEASEMTGISKSIICNVCKGRGHTAGGFRWAYEGESLQNKKAYANSGSRKRVCQYDKDSNLIQVFNSITEASKITGVKIQNISSVCRGRNKSAGGFIWKYKDDKNNKKEK